MKILNTETSMTENRFKITPSQPHPSIVYNVFSQNMIYDGSVVVIADKRKTKTLKVTDEMFRFSFKTSVSFKKQNFSIEIFSVPFVVTVHTSQNADAYSTVIWKNALSQKMPNENGMTWNRIVGQMQSRLIAYVGENTRPLTSDQLNCLKSKVCRLNEEEKEFSSINPVVTKAQFCIDKLVDVKLPFFHWYYGTFHLIQNHCKKAFNKGYIMGYVKRRKAESKLMGQEPGTFLIRFSDSILSAISIVWVDGAGKVQSHCPLGVNDLPQTNPLANIICNNKLLTCVYTENGNVDKMIAFGKDRFKPKTELTSYKSLLTKFSALSTFSFNASVKKESNPM